MDGVMDGAAPLLLVLLMATVLSTGAAASPATAAGAEDEALKASLMKMEQDAMERWRNGDPMRWAEISAPEVTYVDPGLTKPIVGLEAYTRYLEALKGKVHYQGSEFVDPKVVRYGDLAVMTYNYRSTENNPDGSVKAQSLWNTTEVYGLIDGAWKIVFTHWSFVDHAAPEQVELPIAIALSPTPPTGVLGELLAHEQAAMERWRKGDPWGFTELSAADVTYFDQVTPRRLDGLAALQEYYGKVAGQVHFDVMDFVEPRAQAHGDAAVLSYRFISGRLRGEGTLVRGTPWNCTEVFAKVGGQWKLVHTHWSVINGQQKQEKEKAQ